MADWYGYSRSNYFKVKNREQFEAWVDGIDDLEILAEEDGRFAINGDRNGGWPYARYDDAGDDTLINLPLELSAHLADGEIAVLIEAGAEKLRYITGDAVAVNHRGEHVSLSLEQTTAWPKRRSATSPRPRGAKPYVTDTDEQRQCITKLRWTSRNRQSPVNAKRVVGPDLTRMLRTLAAAA